VRRFDFESAAPDDPTLTAEELSGLARVRGDEYLAIGDAHAVVHRMTIRIDPASGAVRSAEIGAAIPLRDERGSRFPEPKTAKDREGIVCDPESGHVWIANERTGADARSPSIARYRLADGTRTAEATCEADSSLAVFRSIRSNRGFESLALDAEGSAIWTANEDALTIDGAPAGESAPGLVRLQKLDLDLRPLAQFAYPVDPWQRPIRSPRLLAGREISGLTELVALPGGRLLALERAFCGDARGAASLRNRLYLVDPAGATDVTPYRSGLAGRSVAPVRKALLWETNWGLTNSNFEGMALGPELGDGSRALVLIADNNAGTSQALFTLRLLPR
jgi:hypothetical protein